MSFRPYMAGSKISLSPSICSPKLIGVAVWMTPSQPVKHSLNEPGFIKSASNILSLFLAPLSYRRWWYLYLSFMFLTVVLTLCPLSKRVFTIHEAINPEPAVTATVYFYTVSTSSIKLY